MFESENMISAVAANERMTRKLCSYTTRHVKEIIVGNRQQFTGSVTSHTRTIVYPLRNHSGKPSQYRDRSMEPHFSFATFLLLKATHSELSISMGHLEFISRKKKENERLRNGECPLLLRLREKLNFHYKENKMFCLSTL